MTRSTFSGFTIAQLAMRASQRALDVTGQNIANINTEGYTRQRVDLLSLNLRGGDFVSTGPASKIGYGVEITGISQIRDPFLDVQFRNQIAKVGTADAHQATLDRLGDIFDETEKEGIRKALSDLSSSLDDMTSQAGENVSDSIVRSRCQVLLNYMHQKADDLAHVREETITDMENTEIPDLNSLLSDIGELNNGIWESQLLGNPALELQDERNQKLDELASYIPITVTYKEVDVGGGKKLEYPVVKFNGANGNSFNLTSGEHGENVATFSVSRNKVKTDQKDAEGNFIYKEDGTVSISVIPATEFKDADVSFLKTDITNDLKEGTLKGAVDMVNKSGDFDNPPTDYNGIGYYEKAFNGFVNKFAQVFNELNTNGDEFNNGQYVLFKTSDGSNTFTAANIQINDDWMNNKIHIVPAYPNTSAPDEEVGSKENTNIMKMLKALTEEQDFRYYYNPEDAFNPDESIRNDPNRYITFFKGGFDECYSNMENTQGLDSKANTAILNNHTSVLQQTANNKDAVSGVSLDEEGINLMQYQRSYTAAARFMTTLNDILEILISNTGV